MDFCGVWPLPDLDEVVSWTCVWFSDVIVWATFFFFFFFFF